jgi:hypothetical protein
MVSAWAATLAKGSSRESSNLCKRILCLTLLNAPLFGRE